MFGGQNCEMYEAVYRAIIECGGGEGTVYDWLENTPKTTLTVTLVDKLLEMGFIIKKVK